MKKIFLQSIIFLLFSTSIFVFSSYGQEVLVDTQPDSPLQLSNAVPRWRISINPWGQKWNMLAVEFISQNVSNKTISAYTIRQFSDELNKPKGLTLFSYTTTASGLLKPFQLRNQGIGEGGYREIPKSIILAVDFVEFTDGSTWGKDITESAQQLAGVRAGVKASLEYLKKINNQNGIEAVIKALDEIKDLLPPENQNEIWKSGFKKGVTNIKYYIMNAYEKEGIKAAEIELQKHFDISSTN